MRSPLIYIAVRDSADPPIFMSANRCVSSLIYVKNQSILSMIPTDDAEAYGFPTELGDFVSCIGEGKQPYGTCEDDLLVDRTVDAAYRSVKSRKRESI